MLDEQQAQKLKPLLEELMRECDYVERRRHDPVEFAWEYKERLDRELVALLSSCLAYGRVELLKAGVKVILELLGPRPTLAVDEMGPDALAGELGEFVYRMTKGADVVDLLIAIRKVQSEYGSLEAAYASAPEDDHLSRASFLVQKLRAARVRDEFVRGLRYLLPDPADGSTCKRLHLFFRWMGRGPDGIDLGTWEVLDPADLIMPLDTHTSRLCRYIGLCDRKSTDLKAALEVTESLRMMDADDPLKYDFALCHLGISGSCIHKRSEEHCPSCPIESVCTL
ncbi:TIGR02757 family protein [Persicimonas caeni]|uniref:TIGR02757 family protein n=1 Tax=Persicimonas caeni TaxID=2292766 RepID=A0A4Y6Q349_PERCE|nr:TIGR02757 family protein [Persicimonas caeni]QDG54597.1 TIGR02757 family protein [Persicimonas caeni]QED35818.1 TIGR02757 family protein [Persicimonas caeni]